MDTQKWILIGAGVVVLYLIAAWMLGLPPFRCNPVGPPEDTTTGLPTNRSFWDRLVARARRTRVCREIRRQLSSNRARAAFQNAALPANAPHFYRPNSFVFVVERIPREDLDEVLAEFDAFDFYEVEEVGRRWRLYVTVR